MITYLNGDFLQPDECHINPLDRGFLFGDGVYEVMPVYDKQIFLYEEHMKRLAYSLKQTEIKNPYTTKQWKQAINELIEKDGQDNLSVYLQVSRGVTLRDHAAPVDSEPTVFMMTMEAYPNTELRNGVATITVEDIRWGRCDIKSINLLANVMMRRQAKQMNAHEAIIITDGYLLEGATSNVFTIKNNPKHLSLIHI